MYVYACMYVQNTHTNIHVASCIHVCVTIHVCTHTHACMYSVAGCNDSEGTMCFIVVSFHVKVYADVCHDDVCGHIHGTHIHVVQSLLGLHPVVDLSDNSCGNKLMWLILGR